MAKKTLDELIRGKERIFVKNTSRPKGIIVVNFVHPASGQNHPFEVPKTWIPIEITSSLPLDIIEQSLDFRAYINKGMLTIVPEKEALETLKSKEAKSEQKRIYASRHSELNVQSEALDAAKAKADEMEVKKTMEDKVSPQVKAIVLDLEDNPEKEDEILNRLRSIEEEMQDIDLTYVQKEARKKKIRSWAKTILAKRYEKGDDDNNDDNNDDNDDNDDKKKKKGKKGD